MAKTLSGLAENLPLQTLAGGASWDKGPATPSLAAASTWNVEHFLDAVRQKSGTIDWTAVMAALDHDGFELPSFSAFCFLMRAYRHASGGVSNVACVILVLSVTFS